MRRLFRATSVLTVCVFLSSCAVVERIETGLNIERWDVPTALQKIDDFVPVTNIVAEQIYLANCQKPEANATLDRFVVIREQIQQAKFAVGNAYAAYKNGEKGDLAGAIIPLVRSVGDIVKLIEEYQGQQYLDSKYWVILGTITNLAELGMSKIDLTNTESQIPVLKQWDFQQWASQLKGRCS